MELADALWVLPSIVVAAVIGLAGPRTIASLPEPEPHPDDVVDDGVKALYVDVAAAPGAALRIALLAAVLAGVSATALVAADERALVPVWTLFCGMGAWLAFVDHHTRYLPFALTVVLHVVLLLALVVTAAATGEWTLLAHALVANVVVFVVFRLLWTLAPGGGLGYGDVRLSGSIGLVLGPLGLQAVVIGAYAGFVLGSVVALVALARRRTGRKDHYALGPYLVVGTVLGPVATAFL